MDPELLKALLGQQGLTYKEKKKPRRVIVYNYKTGEWAEYSSAYYFINKYKLSNRVVLARLNAGEIKPSGNWYYSYYDPNNIAATQGLITNAAIRRALNY